MTLRSILAHVRVVAVLSSTVGASAMAQDVAAVTLPGYSPANAATQRAIEADAIGRPRADRARAHSKVLSSETHVAGSPAQERSRDYVIQQMRAMGLETEVRSYRAYMPYPTSVRLWRIAPTEKELVLSEPAVAGDPSSARAHETIFDYMVAIENLTTVDLVIDGVDMSSQLGKDDNF